MMCALLLRKCSSVPSREIFQCSRSWLRGLSQSSSDSRSGNETPSQIRLQRAQKAIEIDFTNGNTFRYPAELLRVESPSVENKRLDTSGQTRVISGRRHVNILSVESVGHYAIRIKFDDLHETGIYTWSFLHELGHNKFGRIRAYLKKLKEKRLSRDPSSK
mmetsp:Transcript_48972/g.93594  ORF Transcript_48972/g.93594 Transcript_48972/m.93594 type:complete len:161 (-) Transcript_48972:577-1059(-)